MWPCWQKHTDNRLHQLNWAKRCGYLPNGSVFNLNSCEVCHAMPNLAEQQEISMPIALHTRTSTGRNLPINFAGKNWDWNDHSTPPRLPITIIMQLFLMP